MSRPLKLQSSKAKTEPRVDHQTREEQIYEAAARLICEKGFGQSSMSDIAEAMGMTKAGIYHHIDSKEDLLFRIMMYGMDLFEEKVRDRVVDIRDPVERLRAAIRAHVLLYTRDRPKEITVVLNEGYVLHSHQQERVNERKRDYLQFLQNAIKEVIEAGKAEPIDPKLAALALLGMINWMYRWYRPDGRLRDTEIAESITDFFLRGLLKPVPTT